MLTPSRRRPGGAAEWHAIHQCDQQAREKAGRGDVVRRLQHACARPASGRACSKDGAMEGLRWWLLLLTALMFSMSG
jgi:hypothetical protein